MHFPEKPLAASPHRLRATCAIQRKKFPKLVIPAQAGIQLQHWIPACAGMTELSGLPKNPTDRKQEKP